LIDKLPEEKVAEGAVIGLVKVGDIFAPAMAAEFAMFALVIVFAAILTPVPAVPPVMLPSGTLLLLVATVHLPVVWFQLNICPVVVGAGVDSHAVPFQESSWPVAVGAGADNPKVAPDVAFNETILPEIWIPGVVPPAPTWFHADPL